MCKKYIVLRHDGAKEAEVDDLNSAFRHGEDVIKGGHESAAIYERISVAKPTRAVAWEGRRRPGLTGPLGGHSVLPSGAEEEPQQ